jgi:hypothetical protein
MKYWLYLFLLLSPALAEAASSAGLQGFNTMKNCVMQNDANYCHSVITPDSYPLFDRFFAYKLMPCLPTDFTYQNEVAQVDGILVTATMPASNDRHYTAKMVFLPTPSGLKFDLPQSLKAGMGPNWENKIQLSEQLFLMMKANMGDKLNCDVIYSLIKK